MINPTVARLRAELEPRRLLPSLSAGIVIGIITVISEISYAALLFSGRLADHVAQGIALILTGAIIMLVVVALTSSLRCAVAMPQDSPVAILALVAAAINIGLPTAASTDAVFVTLVAAIAAASLLTGVFFFVLGRFRLGRLIRFVPYPVIGGFLAGTGWLLVLGSVTVMTGTPLTWSRLDMLVQPDALIMWVPGLLFAILLSLILRKHHHSMIVPAMLLVATIIFYVLLWGSGTPFVEARARGWFMETSSQGAVWQPLTPSALSQVDWSLVVRQMDKFGTILIVAVIGLLLNITALELSVRQDLDLNHELKAAGIGNVLAGLFGAPPGFHTLSLSTLAYQTGANTRLVGLVTAGFCGVVLIFGGTLVSFFPRPILGGLLLFQGLSFLINWLYDARLTLPRSDYALVVAILVGVVTLGYLPGVALGIGIAMVLFVVNYSRTRVVRHVFTGANYHSAVDRPAPQRRLLREKGTQLHIMRLQGFVFFGTAISLLNQVRQRLADTTLAPLRFLVLDFGRVDGVDSSAVSGFVRIKQLAEPAGIQLVFSGLSRTMDLQLKRGGLDGASDTIHFSPSLDRGVEWCEDQILASTAVPASTSAETLRSQLEEMFPDSTQRAAFLNYLEPLHAEKGFCLMHQGEVSDSIYFVESGLVTTQVEFPDGKRMRLRTIRAGTVVGEVGLYSGGLRTASAFTSQPSTLYRLSAASIERMKANDPELAAGLLQFVARSMAERLAENNNLLRALMD